MKRSYIAWMALAVLLAAGLVLILNPPDCFAPLGKSCSVLGKFPRILIEGLGLIAAAVLGLALRPPHKPN
jgi:hypothetical protein